LLVKHFVTEFFLNPMSVVFFTYPASFLSKKTVSFKEYLDEKSRDLLLKLYYRFLSPEVSQLEIWNLDTKEAYDCLQAQRRGFAVGERENLERENALLKSEVDTLRAEVARLRDAQRTIDTDNDSSAFEGSPSKRARTG